MGCQVQNVRSVQIKQRTLAGLWSIERTGLPAPISEFWQQLCEPETPSQPALIPRCKAYAESLPSRRRPPPELNADSA